MNTPDAAEEEKGPDGAGPMEPIIFALCNGGMSSLHAI
jgi:hypothetical protein